MLFTAHVHVGDQAFFSKAGLHPADTSRGRFGLDIRAIRWTYNHKTELKGDCQWENVSVELCSQLSQ